VNSDTDLALQEQQYDELNQRLKANLPAAQAFVEDLKKMHAEALYKIKYKTFEQYARAELEIGKSHAYRLLDHKGKKPKSRQKKPASTTAPKVEELEELEENIPKPDEGQERLLKQLTEDEREGAWKEAVKRCDGKAPDRKTLEGVVVERLDDEITDSKKGLRKDNVGNVIHSPQVAAAFDQTGHIKGLCREIQRVRKQVAELCKMPVGAQIPENRVDMALKEAWHVLKNAMPHAVLAAGAVNKGHKWEHIGWVTEMQYEALPPDRR
jgi:hypothetical protein